MSCSGPGSDRLKWIESVVAESTYVFLARVTDTSDRAANLPGTFGSAEVQVKRHLKGAAGLRAVDVYVGNFSPKRGEERVFFVDSRGVILPCTEYKYFSTNEDLIRAIQHVLRKHAT